MSQVEPHLGDTDTSDPASVKLNIPVSSRAGYPFTGNLYDIYVTNLDSPAEHIHGKIVEIYYGFTPKTKQDYLANNDVPWFNARGEAIAEGTLDPGYHHDGDYKGHYVTAPLTVQVPRGMNLVYRIRYERYGGTAWGTDVQRLGQAETQTYFVENNVS